MWINFSGAWYIPQELYVDFLFSVFYRIYKQGDQATSVVSLLRMIEYPTKNTKPLIFRHNESLLCLIFSLDPVMWLNLKKLFLPVIR